jgi:hypothetical protein
MQRVSLRSVLACVAGALLMAPTPHAQGVPGEALAAQKISALEGGFTGAIEPLDEFGVAVVSPGDLDDDGVADLVVGAWGDDDAAGGSGLDRGALYVLFLNADGTVKSHQKISETEGGFTADLDDFDRFGHSFAALGDFDGDGVEDVAVSNIFDDDGTGNNQGAIFLLMLDTDGTVKSHVKISETAGGFTGLLDPGDLFGHSIAFLGDLDGDGNDDLAVGADGDDDGGTAGQGSATGAFWILFLEADGTVKAQQKVSATTGGFGGTLRDGDGFGHTLANLGDLDGDGVLDLAVGAPGDDDGVGAGGTGAAPGALWICFMDSDGTVKSELKLSQTSGNGFTGPLLDDRFSESLGVLGDLDGDGVGDLAVGGILDDEGPFGLGSEVGSTWVLLMNADGTVKTQTKLGFGVGGFDGILLPQDHFGHSLAVPGDLDGDGRPDLVIGAPGSFDGGGASTGALWVVFLNAGVWETIPGGVSGTHGLPLITGAGTMVEGEPASVSLSGALENAPAGLFLGFSQLGAPFKGGVLVPNNDILLDGLVTSAAGAIDLATVWPPAIPAGTGVWYQYWIADGAALKGLAASDGLKGTSP